MNWKKMMCGIALAALAATAWATGACCNPANGHPSSGTITAHPPYGADDTATWDGDGEPWLFIHDSGGVSVAARKTIDDSGSICYVVSPPGQPERAYYFTTGGDFDLWVGGSLHPATGTYKVK